MQATAYGAVDFTHEHDAFLSPSPASPASSSRRPRASLATWSKVAIGTAVAIAGVSYCVTVTSTLATQNEVIARMQQQIEAMHAVVVQSAAAAADAPSTVSTSASSSLWSVSLSTSKPLPNKFAVPHVTPLKTQDNRGTCWDFATIGPLEQTYRTQGIHNGWLKRDEYVALSEQAYGAEVLRLCAGEPGSPQQVACLIPGNQIWKNSTEGGESAELFFLQHGFENSVFPHSICPYAVDAGSDTVCPALTPQKRATNPLKLRVRRMDTLYDEASVKRALVDDARAMAFTTSMPYITYYYPCVGELLKSDPRCDAASPSCTLCPAAFPQTTCCIPVTKRENYNMAGEFITSADMQPEGGHVMTVVGYTDTFQTEQGFTGGFILKNSWWDGVHPALGPAHARGSHSIQYWLEEVSDWEERSMCPNSHDPANWYQCGETGEVIHANANAGSSTRSALAGNATEVLAECLSNETALYARTNLQPLTLRCTDATYCRTDDSVVYFATNTSDYGDRMQRMCFFEFDRATDAAAAVCLPPLLPQQIAYILTPVEAETLENDPDVCGHYLYPFEVLQQYKRQFGNFYVNNFDVEWHPQSFAANAHHYPELDYADVKASTKVQNQYAFTGPFPFARVVDKKDLPKVVATAAGDVGSAQ